LRSIMTQLRLTLAGEPDNAYVSAVVAVADVLR